MRGVFESEGDIRSVDLLSALVTLWRERSGDSLRFSRPGATAGFDLIGGLIADRAGMDFGRYLATGVQIESFLIAYMRLSTAMLSA